MQRGDVIINKYVHTYYKSKVVPKIDYQPCAYVRGVFLFSSYTDNPWPQSENT